MAHGKLTMLQVVQKTLEALNLDEVNSISDSPDAEQVAQIAQDSAYDLLNQSEWPFSIRYTQLESIADSDRPNYLRIPDEVTRIDFVRYDKTDPGNQDSEGTDLVEIPQIDWLPPEEFLEMTLLRNSQTEAIVPITDFNGTQHLIYNDRGPDYWTSFDDQYVVFDAVNLDLESTLQGNKSQAHVKWIQDIIIDDSFQLDAPAHFFSTWLADVKSTAFVYMKQEASPKDEQRARRGLSVLRRNAARTDADDGKVKFGRRTRY
jgi:hypothetical protein